MVQLTFAVTVTDPDDAADASDSEVGDTVRLLAVVPACVTAMVRAASPPPVTLTTPLRLAVPVFAVTLTVKLPLLVPLVGDTVIQV